eukprot:maker-scaffold_15-snap-gene-8.2-mRNA-1 protein AED:0.03 eAED:0.03 QI:298/1/1/1/0.5/0.2/5/29/361
MRNTVLRRCFTTQAIKHPFISCKPLFDPTCSRKSRDRFLDEVHAALKTNGYFYAADIEPLDQSYIKRSYSFLEELHQLPKEQKMKFVKPHGTYSGLDCGEEYAELNYEEGTVSSVRSWDFTMKHSYENYGLNYPTEKEQNLSQSFKEFMDESYLKQNLFGEKFVAALEEILSLKEGTLTKSFFNSKSKKFADEDLGTVRFLYYPGSSENETKEANLGISAHTDFELFTLMHQDNHGLQFLKPLTEKYGFSRDWIDAPVSEHFVVTVGDCLERFTNGYLLATPHRVIQREEPRRSIIRFAALEPEAKIEPLVEHNPGLFGTNPRYTPTTMKQHMSTTLNNLNQGMGSWDQDKHQSLTATYKY